MQMLPVFKHPIDSIDIFSIAKMSSKDTFASEIVTVGLTTARKTLSHFGFELNYNDEYIEEFTRFAGSTKGTIGDFGCGYGATAQRFLAAGTCKIIANDLSKDQLDIFFNSLSQSDKERVQLIPGNALELGEKITHGTLAGIFAASWLHFLQPEDVRKCFKMFYQLIEPGGKLSVTTSTTFRDPTASKVCEKRRMDGEEWPGTGYPMPRMPIQMPDFLHALDPDILEREAKSAGFVVEKAGFIDIGSVFEALNGDGREFAGMLAVKPELI